MVEVDVEAAVERARRAWVYALEAHVRAADRHAKTAALYARSGRHPEHRRAELDRLEGERAEFDAEVARRPEWAKDAPAWPALDADAGVG